MLSFKCSLFVLRFKPLLVFLILVFLHYPALFTILASVSWTFLHFSESEANLSHSYSSTSIKAIARDLRCSCDTLVSFYRLFDLLLDFSGQQIVKISLSLALRFCLGFRGSSLLCSSSDSVSSSQVFSSLITLVDSSSFSDGLPFRVAIRVSLTLFVES